MRRSGSRRAPAANRPRPWSRRARPMRGRRCSRGCRSCRARPSCARPSHERRAAFMEEQVYPNEHALAADDDAAEALMRELQRRAKAAGLWAMFIGPDAGGTGTGFLPYVYLNEVIGRSLVAPRIFGCQAPDTGNAEILHEFGTPEQKARWLRPLVAGEVRSFFAMTVPEVSGSDPRGLRARAERPGAPGA